MPFDKSQSPNYSTVYAGGDLVDTGSQRPWWTPLFWFLAVMILGAYAVLTLGCASVPTLPLLSPAEPATASPLLPTPVLPAVGQLPRVLEAAKQQDGKCETCDRTTVVNPPEMKGVPGLWFNSIRLGSIPETGCWPPPNVNYTRWSIQPAGTRFKVYHRPFDVAMGTPDPTRFGNWAVITNPMSGTEYTITTENGGSAGSTTVLVVVAK